MLAVAPRPKATQPRRALTSPGCRPMSQPIAASGASTAASAARMGTRKAREKSACHRPTPAASAATNPAPSAQVGGRRKAQAGRLPMERKAKNATSPPPTHPANRGIMATRLKCHSDPPEAAATRKANPANAPRANHTSPQRKINSFCRLLTGPPPLSPQGMATGPKRPPPIPVSSSEHSLPRIQAHAHFL